MNDPQPPGEAGSPPGPANPSVAPVPWGPASAPTGTVGTGPSGVRTVPRGPEDHGERPPPRPASLLSAGAGLLLISSMIRFLDEIGGDNERFAGQALSLLFLLLGVGLMLLARDRRTADAGVALSGFAVVPLLVYLFVDVRDPENSFGDPTDFTTTTTLILLAAAAVWLVAYFAGPGRRYGFFLGAALVALWLVAVVQIVDEPLGALAGPATATFEPVGPGFGDDFGVIAEDGFSGTGGAFDDGTFDQPSFDDEVFFDDWSTPEPSNPAARLGWVSLAFGGAYLAVARWRDRAGDQRQATALFAVAIPVLTFAVFSLTEPLDAEGAAIVAIVLGAVAVWLGSAAGRRFTSWYGTVAAVVGVQVLVTSALEDSARAIAGALLVIGVVLAAAATRFGDASSPLRPDDGSPSGGPTSAPPAAPWSAPVPTGAGQATPGPVPPAGGYPPPPGATPWSAPGREPAAPPPSGAGPPATSSGSWSAPRASDPWAAPPDRDPG